MRASRLLILVPSLAFAVQALAADTDKGMQLINHVVPTYGVRQDVPFRQPSRIEVEITKAQAFVTDLNARLLTRGVSSAEIKLIDDCQTNLDKVASELVPAASAYETQQLDGIASELARASESIALLTATVPPPAAKTSVIIPAASTAPATEKPAAAAPAVKAPALAAETPIAPEVPVAPAVPVVEAPAVEVPVEVPAEAMTPVPEVPAAAVEAAPAPEMAPAPEVVPAPEAMPVEVPNP